ncbi:hypothetical protein [Leucothrix arctica]|uniref:DUF3592 domain-containing protein n=1 Tax=Leucothrix arctica TaxID=1481894 RepID=A0A317CBK4_9GAMM|nr:hypothetical protein [Leucothrix arctica]PWQ94693.1 hypothetical protein DKT75_15490 [Leucothrix arctica]
MGYKVSTKSGRTYRASKIEHKPGFLEMHCWDGEHRIPAGEVTYIKSTGFGQSAKSVFPGFLMFFILFVIFFLVIVKIFAPY